MSQYLFNRRTKNKQSGFTLLEVMVTLVITALGLLGIAALQAQSLRLNKGAESRAQALTLANEIAERIEANNEGAVAGSYASPVDAGFDDLATLNGSACGIGACASNMLGVYDVGIWRNQIATNAILPSGLGAIAVVNNGGTPALFTYTINVCWQDRVEAYDKRDAVDITTPICGGTASPPAGQMSVRLTRTIYDRVLAN
jgi:type IV pilus assembly protein PilV